MNAPALKIRLTELSHGGGCGCKISPALLAEILAKTPAGALPKELLVGTETADDAAVYRLNDRQALVATTDFFTPIVDDPYDFGRIAATNALSDVYAMGARPILALAVVGMPVDRIAPEAVRRILEGGESVCAAAGVPIAGGHSIDTLEPIYGLVGIGICSPEKILRNSAAKDKDLLILGKPLGIGILSAALKKGTLSESGYGAMLAVTTQLNTPGMALAELPGVHAMTDVTGFGLAGHLLEMCRGSGLQAEVFFSKLPFIGASREFAMQGTATGASKRNWESYGAEVRLPDGFADWQRNLLTDPQTSGGLLVACAPEAEGDVLRIFRNGNFQDAKTIGRFAAGPARLSVV